MSERRFAVFFRERREDWVHSRLLYFSTSRHTEPSDLRSCVKVEVTFLGSPSLIVLVVSVDVKQP